MPDLNFGQLMGVIIIGGFLLLALVDKVLANRRQERLHRERLAMIEKGIVPPPETDPRKWEAFVAGSAGPANEIRTEVQQRMRRRMRRDHHPADVARAFAVLLIAVACGLGILIHFIGAGSRVAAGVSGLFFSLGAGFLVLSFLGKRRGTASEASEKD